MCSADRRAKRPSFGFGPGTSHLPQPASWGEVSVEVQERDPDSTLRLYRDALALRRVLQTGEQLEWIPPEPDVVRFRRPNGWEVVMNFGPVSVALPEGEVLLFSSPLEAGRLGGESTVWLRRG